GRVAARHGRVDVGDRLAHGGAALHRGGRGRSAASAAAAEVGAVAAQHDRLGVGGARGAERGGELAHGVDGEKIAFARTVERDGDDGAVAGGCDAAHDGCFSPVESFSYAPAMRSASTMRAGVSGASQKRTPNGASA